MFSVFSSVAIHQWEIAKESKRRNIQICCHSIISRDLPIISLGLSFPTFYTSPPLPFLFYLGCSSCSTVTIHPLLLLHNVNGRVLGLFRIIFSIMNRFHIFHHHQSGAAQRREICKNKNPNVLLSVFVMMVEEDDPATTYLIPGHNGKS